MGKHQTKKPSAKPSFLVTFFNAPAAQGGYCSPDVCFANGPAFSTTTLIPPSSMLQHENLNQPLETSILRTSASLLPVELFEVIKRAAKQGFLISFLITLVNEGATDLLRKLSYSPERIYLINQVLRALLMLTLSNSPILALAVPVGSYVLNKYGKMSNEEANLFITSLAVGSYLTSSSNSFFEASLTLLSSVSSSLLGSRVAQFGYRFLTTGLFSSNENDSDDETAPSSKALAKL